MGRVIAPVPGEGMPPPPPTIAFAVINVGDPSTRVLFVIDSGSDLPSLVAADTILGASRRRPTGDLICGTRHRPTVVAPSPSPSPTIRSCLTPTHPSCLTVVAPLARRRRFDPRLQSPTPNRRFDLRYSSPPDWTGPSSGLLPPIRYCLTPPCPSCVDRRRPSSHGRPQRQEAPIPVSLPFPLIDFCGVGFL
ncbi:hypothetical protein PVAP13_5NG225805 [Panicum virgatum]|uniref:Uncharacterized protein n=1 Tax=Panicum virgatum TaxID=38727 RepID=A0A8T0RXQ6_PANVG|nr:hypothetical protein PVAP13_5NG225805 [Panicum virgatum]